MLFYVKLIIVSNKIIKINYNKKITKIIVMILTFYYKNYYIL